MSIAAQARYLKPALIGVVVVDLIALAAFSVRVEEVRHTTTVPAASSPAVLPPAAVPGTPVPVPPAVEVATVDLPVATPEAPAAPRPAPAASPTARPSSSPTPVNGPTSSAARCPVEIAEPDRSGGLQSLIGFAPAFGPFKDEAFAAATAYQPVLQLIGPILARYPALAPRLEPAMTQFLNAFAGLLDTGYSLLEPLYGPRRQAFLEAEGKLAAAFSPYAQALADSALAGCLIELQSALLAG